MVCNINNNIMFNASFSVSMFQIFSDIIGGSLSEYVLYSISGVYVLQAKYWDYHRFFFSQLFFYIVLSFTRVNFWILHKFDDVLSASQGTILKVGI